MAETSSVGCELRCSRHATKYIAIHGTKFNDLKVFFFIDPDIDEDPNCIDVDNVVLNYTFHKVESAEDLPRLPGFEHIKGFLFQFNSRAKHLFLRKINEF